eukprot:c15157_g1_i2.p1 GENE.c15157_g1_i2~~c15157_g1_i2.p1  ORF type:complete len:306 (+),score=33.74 c15157_g1_i2:134-1051(+)
MSPSVSRSILSFLTRFWHSSTTSSISRHFSASTESSSPQGSISIGVRPPLETIPLSHTRSLPETRSFSYPDHLGPYFKKVPRDPRTGLPIAGIPQQRSGRLNNPTTTRKHTTNQLTLTNLFPHIANSLSSPDATSDSTQTTLNAVQQALIAHRLQQIRISRSASPTSSSGSSSSFQAPFPNQGTPLPPALTKTFSPLSPPGGPSPQEFSSPPSARHRIQLRPPSPLNHASTEVANIEMESQQLHEANIAMLSKLEVCDAKIRAKEVDFTVEKRRQQALFAEAVLLERELQMIGGVIRWFGSESKK